ncbi:DMT family transporter [Nakamurella flavida]|uniref:DMT family transporter n=1 Tax=Nakamurella flavida TaxID=363630 RepID=A0A938YME5_9ACTN|nr:DMT family transporter [Nakamurella flavida]MBM9476037.1 DMT family transporter [Nakamurella flavida]MDP9777220.1 drug/metabolite transporter (DMT)-like permease [Nakamurella flavida]
MGVLRSSTSGPTRAPRDLTWLIAVAAALWGTDALLRLPLAETVAAPTIVFAEHLVLTLVLAPLLPRSLRAFRRLDAGGRWAVVGIGVGASAIATTLFTLSFTVGDPITPAVVQKLQPVVALVGAAWLLGERLSRRFWWFALPALAGVWLLAFPDPFHVAVDHLVAVLLALGAAVLWAGGTVLGRLVATRLEPLELTTLRFSFGLPAMFVVVLATGSPLWVPDVPSSLAVLGIALVPGLGAMALYYVGLRRTPASRATLAELAYPLTAALIGVFVLSRPLEPVQWVGAVLVVASVTALSWHENRARDRALVTVA